MDLWGRLSNPVQRRPSAAEIDELIGAYRDGATLNELADQFDIHRTTVRSHLDHHDVPIRSTTWSLEDLTVAAEQYESGDSLSTIAARYGIDPSTVANRFRRADISIRPRRGWPHTQGPAATWDLTGL